VAVRDTLGNASTANTTLIRFATTFEEFSKHVNKYVYVPAPVPEQALFAGNVQRAQRDGNAIDDCCPDECDDGDLEYRSNDAVNMVLGDGGSFNDDVAIDYHLCPHIGNDPDTCTIDNGDVVNDDDCEGPRDRSNNSTDDKFCLRWSEPPSEEAQKLAEDALLSCCHILTVGQRCYDWAVLRRFHLTGTTTAHLIGRYNKWEAARDKTNDAIDKMADLDGNVTNRHLDQLRRNWLDAEMMLWRAARKSWCDTRSRSSDAMKCGHENESCIMEELCNMARVARIWNVGLLESRAYPQLAVSPDAFAWVQSREDSSSYQLLCVEIKTKVAVTTVESAQKIASSMSAKWIDVFLGSAEFRRCIPEVMYRRQVAHQLLVTGAPACLYVVARAGSVIYMVTVVATDEGLRHHKRACDNLVNVLALKWPFVEDFGSFTALPDAMPPGMREDFLSHYWLWASMRLHVLRQGPFKTPMCNLYHSFQVLYNHFMGGIDSSSERFQELKFIGHKPPWPAHVVMRGVSICALNAWHCYKLHLVRSLLEKTKYKSLRWIRARMNSIITFKEFVRRVGMAILLDPESAGFGCVAARSTPSRQEDVAIGLQRHEQMEYLQTVAKRNRYGQARWFNTEEGKQLRFCNLDGALHTSVSAKKRRCTFCSLLRRSTTNKRQPRNCCVVCTVNLCRKSRSFPKSLVDADADDNEEIVSSCFELWHTVKELPTNFTQSLATCAIPDTEGHSAQRETRAQLGDPSSPACSRVAGGDDAASATPLSLASPRLWVRKSPSRAKRRPKKRRR